MRSAETGLASVPNADASLRAYNLHLGSPSVLVVCGFDLFLLLQPQVVEGALGVLLDGDDASPLNHVAAVRVARHMRTPSPPPSGSHQVCDFGVQGEGGESLQGECAWAGEVCAHCAAGAAAEVMLQKGNVLRRCGRGACTPRDDLLVRISCEGARAQQLSNE